MSSQDRHAFPTSDVDLFTPVSTGVMLTKDARGRAVVGIAQVEVIGEPRPDTPRDALVAEATRYFEAPVNILSLNEMLTASYRQTLDVLWLCSLLVLVVTVFNVASVMATHALTRVAEWGVKGALGASRGALLRDTVRESSVVCVAGAAVGFTLAWQSLSVLNRRVRPRILRMLAGNNIVPARANGSLRAHEIVPPPATSAESC